MRTGCAKILSNLSLTENRYTKTIPSPSILADVVIPYRRIAAEHYTGTFSTEPADRLTGWWFNPRNGKSIRIRNIEKGERVEFVSPDPGEQLDWVLIIDDAGKGYKKP